MIFGVPPYDLGGKPTIFGNTHFHHCGRKEYIIPVFFRLSTSICGISVGDFATSGGFGELRWVVVKEKKPLDLPTHPADSRNNTNTWCFYVLMGTYEMKWIEANDAFLKLILMVFLWLRLQWRVFNSVFTTHATTHVTWHSVINECLWGARFDFPVQGVARFRRQFTQFNRLFGLEVVQYSYHFIPWNSRWIPTVLVSKWAEMIDSFNRKYHPFRGKYLQLHFLLTSEVFFSGIKRSATSSHATGPTCNFRRGSFSHLSQCCNVEFFRSDSEVVILLMEEIPNNHPTSMKPCKWWDIYHINWCRISSINSIEWFTGLNSHICPRNFLWKRKLFGVRWDKNHDTLLK